MKPPDQVLLGLVRQWIAKADVDYRTAERLVGDTEPIRESIAFHCEQAVEKYLKAFLVCQQIEFPKTHSISRLLDLVQPIAPELARSLEEAEGLTVFGVEIRYPSDLPELLPGQEKIVFDTARRAREAIMTQLGHYLSKG
jgi:HEPN domain-containing protein